MHQSTVQILQFFKGVPRSDSLGSIPPHHRQLLLASEERFHDLAFTLAETLSGPELTVALRKLLESKDAATRAAVSIAEASIAEASEPNDSNT